RWLAEAEGPGNAWYEEVLKVNPRLSWRRPTDGDREQLLLTGVRHKEAVDFSCWLGDDFDVPTVAEWRKVDQFLRHRRLSEPEREALLRMARHPAARALLEHIVEQVQPTTWGELMLLSGGVFEWVRGANGF